MGNNSTGVFVGSGAASNLVGGAVTGAGNLVSANVNDGIQLYGTGTSYNEVQDNLVGTDKTGTHRLGNGASTLSLISGPQFNTIGGTISAARNVLSLTPIPSATPSVRTPSTTTAPSASISSAALRMASG